MQIEIWPVSRPTPYAGNPRTISPEAIAAVASSIKRFGFRVPIIVDSAGVIIAGHTRLLAAQKLALVEVPVHVAADLNPEQVKALRLVDNRAGEFTEWDLKSLERELDALGEGINLDVFEFDELFEIAEDGEEEKKKGKAKDDDPDLEGGDADAVPLVDESAEAISQRGEVFALGSHRLMCGDSTSADDVQALMGGEMATMIHADPPYGMGKEKDGVENDNLYLEKLDKFQLDWWTAWRKYLVNNGSAYIWGTADDLWRFWYLGGLRASEKIVMKNEIVWNKENGMGMSSDGHRMFATATERCLFFMLGQQDIGNINSEDYFEGFEPIRKYLVDDMKKIGWGAKDVERICGVSMFSHWFSKAQWTMIPEKHYEELRCASTVGWTFFQMPYSQLRAIYNAPSALPAFEAKRQKFYDARTHFDNVHDNMCDVWAFPRVTGEDRHGHATPKPVRLTMRCLKSSAPQGAIVLEPFGGSGTTLVAAAVCGRVCRTMEISPHYCDVIRRRWTKFARENQIDPGSGKLE